MRTIHKYPLLIADTSAIWLPKGATVLDIGYQELIAPHQFQIWTLVDTFQDLEPITFYIRGTGHTLEGYEGPYIKSIHIPRNGLVYHVFGEKK